MKGLKDFLVHIPNKYNETFSTEGGLELYGDRRWSAKEMANTILKVVEVPYFYDGPITVGIDIFVDPTVLFQQIYPKTGEQENIYLVDRERGLYKIDPSLIIAYSTKEGGQWIGHNENLLMALEKEEVKNQGLIHVPQMMQGKKDRKKGKVVIANEDLMPELGVGIDDIVYIDPLMGVDVHFFGKQLTWVRNMDLMAVELKETA